MQTSEHRMGFTKVCGKEKVCILLDEVMRNRKEMYRKSDFLPSFFFLPNSQKSHLLMSLYTSLVIPDYPVSKYCLKSLGCFLVLFGEIQKKLFEEIEEENERREILGKFKGKKKSRFRSFYTKEKEQMRRTKLREKFSSTSPPKRNSECEKDELETLLISERRRQIPLIELRSKVLTKLEQNLTINSSSEKTSQDDILEFLAAEYSKEYDPLPKEARKVTSRSIYHWRNLILNASTDFPELERILKNLKRLGDREEKEFGVTYTFTFCRDFKLWIFLLHSLRKEIADVDVYREKLLVGSIRTRLRSSSHSQSQSPFQFSLGIIQRFTKEHIEFIEKNQFQKKLRMLKKEDKEEGKELEDLEEPYYGEEFDERVMDAICGNYDFERRKKKKEVDEMMSVKRDVMVKNEHFFEVFKLCLQFETFGKEGNRVQKYNACMRAIEKIVENQGGNNDLSGDQKNISIYGRDYRYSCVVCKKREKEVGEFKMCGRCNILRYDCVDCQKKDWDRHKEECNIWKE